MLGADPQSVQCGEEAARTTKDKKMSKIIKAAAAASVLLLGATTLMAQQKDGNVAVDKKAEKGDTNLPAKQAPGGPLTEKQQQKDGNAAVDSVGKNDSDKTGVGSRALGPAKDEKPTDPNTPKQTEIQKLDKEGRGGQQN
jgi:hypothetical protein